MSKEFLISVIYEYFSNLEEKEFKIICSEIINKYIENKNIQKINNSKLLYNYFHRKENNNKLKALFHWKNKSYSIL